MNQMKMEVFASGDGEQVEIIHGGDNIYADLGIPNPEEHKMKAEVVMEIIKLMRATKMTQIELAKIAGIDQPTVSRLLRGQFRDVSVERLLRIVNRMGHRVEVRISKRGFRSLRRGRR